MGRVDINNEFFSRRFENVSVAIIFYPLRMQNAKEENKEDIKGIQLIMLGVQTEKEMTIVFMNNRFRSDGKSTGKFQWEMFQN